MLRTTALSLLSTLSLAAAAAETEGYSLVWSDEFDRDGPVNYEQWDFEYGFVRNHEQQLYLDSNAYCQGGNLVIEARRERVANPDFDPEVDDWTQKRPFAEYTSASLTTEGRQSWLYGRFEVRAKFVAAPGLWPAIWFLGEAGEWPARGEIDLMEFYQGQILANACWGTSKQWVGAWDAVKVPLAELGGETWAESFHLWRMDWTEQEIRLSVDDRLLNVIDLNKTTNPIRFGDAPENPFRQAQHIKLNLAIGGDSGGDPSATVFPSQFLVDYVRIYQKQQP